MAEWIRQQSSKLFYVGSNPAGGATMELWSWFLSIIGVFGLWQAGSFKVWAWIYMLGVEVAWITFAIATEQYGFILGAVGYACVHIRNYLRWKNHVRMV